MKKLIIVLIILLLVTSVFSIYRDRNARGYLYNLTVANYLTVNGILTAKSNIRIYSNTYFQARNNADTAWDNIGKYNTSDRWEWAVVQEGGPTDLGLNPGVGNLIYSTVSAASPDGTEHGFVVQGHGVNIYKPTIESDGAGGADTPLFYIYGRLDVRGLADIAIANVGDDGRGLSSVSYLAETGKSDGIAAYFEGHVGTGVTTDGGAYGVGSWLNVDSGATLGSDVRGLDVGIYESGATCTGRNAYGISIHTEFDDTNPPNAIYPIRINCNDTANHATPDALIFAPNKSAIALTDAAPGTADAYLKIVLQSGEVYRIMLVKE